MFVQVLGTIFLIQFLVVRILVVRLRERESCFSPARSKAAVIVRGRHAAPSTGGSIFADLASLFIFRQFSPVVGIWRLPRVRSVVGLGPVGLSL